MGEDDKIKTLVGIVAEVRATLEDDPPAHAYYPYWQRVPDGAALVVRTAGDPAHGDGEPSHGASQRRTRNCRFRPSAPWKRSSMDRSPSGDSNRS